MENTLFYLMLIAVVVFMVGMALFLWNSRRHTSMCMKSAFFAVIILTILCDNNGFFIFQEHHQLLTVYPTLYSDSFAFY